MPAGGKEADDAAWDAFKGCATFALAALVVGALALAGLGLLIGKLL